MGTTALLPAGRDWDAISAPWSIARLACAALDVIGVRDFAVLSDPDAGSVYWLVPAGTSADWDLPPTRALGAPHQLAIPDASRTKPPGLRWVRVPQPGVWLTDPDLLRCALLVAIDTQREDDESAPRSALEVPMTYQHFDGPQAVRAARRFIRRALDGVLSSSTLNDVVLCVSELAANAVQHAHAEQFLIKLHADEARVRVECHDQASAWPRLRRPNVDETRGRGLVLVDAMAARWGVEQRRFSTTKCVWFEFDVDPAHTRVPPKGLVDGQGRSA
jgi:anti-sigma regulatory factor (Ser/Thr protein kinase)